jgi:hypothetical protein
MVSPLNDTVPDVGVSSRPAIIKKVVLPEPLGPMIPVSSPALISTVASASAVTSV